MRSPAPANAVNERFNMGMRAIVYFVTRRAGLPLKVFITNPYQSC